MVTLWNIEQIEIFQTQLRKYKRNLESTKETFEIYVKSPFKNVLFRNEKRDSKKSP